MKEKWEYIKYLDNYTRNQNLVVIGIFHHYYLKIILFLLLLMTFPNIKHRNTKKDFSFLSLNTLRFLRPETPHTPLSREPL